MLREIMSDAVERGADRGLPDRAAHQGRDGRRARPGSRARCASSRCAVDVPGDDLLDTAGTGGGTPTFNVSTTAAFVAAGAGCRVAKHGNRSATEPLRLGRPARGARRTHRPATRRRSRSCIDEVGFGFMFAPQHHQATRTSSRCARRSACGRSSTSSVRSRTRPARRAS